MVNNNLTTEDIISHLTKMVERMRESDPLLQRGITIEHYAVISPAMVNPLLDYVEELNKDSVLPIGFYPSDQAGKLRQATGRNTFIIEEAPSGGVEYGLLIDIAIKYQRWWLARSANDGWDVCPNCEGHGEHLATYPKHPEDCQDYHIPCEHPECRNGFIRAPGDSNPRLAPGM